MVRISLIGMSGIGKTYWTKKLEKKGFQCFYCDDLIEKKLEKELKPLGYKGINEVSKWMGQPYEKQYLIRSKLYLKFEKEAMIEIIKKIKEKIPNDVNVVIDTTGSVIYTSKEILSNLSKITKVVFLETPESIKKKFYKIYLKDPKPVLWGNSYRRKDNETEDEALKRCYPLLLDYRSKKYNQYANIKIDYFVLRKLSTTKFIEKINHAVL